MVCGEVAVPPATASNRKPVCERLMLGCVPVTTATTEIALGLCVPVTEIVTIPEYVPGGNCDGSAVMESEDVPKAATEPPVDETFNQPEPPELVVAEAENGAA